MNPIRATGIAAAALLLAILSLPAQVIEKPDLAYRAERAAVDDPDALCRADLYLPALPKAPAPALIYFHGGNLVEGTRKNAGLQKMARRLAGQGIAVALVDYRLSPHVAYPAYVQDAAAAAAWILRNAESYGIDPESVFIGGYSAGGYLAALLAMDERFLKAVGVHRKEIAGFISVSGQMATHSTVCSERGGAKTADLADEASPLFHAGAGSRPLLLLVGDADLPGRRAENERMAQKLEASGAGGNCLLQLVAGRTHAAMQGRLPEPGDPAGDALRAFIAKWSARPASR